MVDTASSRTSTNNGSSRRSRDQPVSRNSSARSSAAYHDDYYLQPPQGHGAHAAAPSLRSVSSRFSLREQFATTRRDFEFGFDDASLFERSTLASEHIGDVSDDLTLLGPVIDPSSALQGRGGFDYYDLLVLPPNPSTQAIRRAYYRLFVLLYPDSHPPRSRGAARAYLELVQTAFETLINPESRLMLQWHGGNAPCTSPDDSISSQHRHCEFLRYLLYEQAASDHGSLELGLQLHGGPAAHSSAASAKGSRPLLKPLDFVMSQSFTTPLPDPEDLFGRVSRRVAILVAMLKARAYGLPREKQSEDHDKSPQPLVLASQRTFLTVEGSVYGLLEELTSLPAHVLTDPYHPCIPTHVPRERAIQLLDGRIQPRVTVKIQHELPPSVSGLDPSNKPSGIYGPGAIVELESEILPDPALAVGVSQEITLPKDSRPSLLQLSARCNPWNRSLPRIGATLQRPWSGGFVQCKLESGDWTLRPDQTCQAFMQFSALSRQIVNLSSPARLTPRIELSYRAPSSLESATASLAHRSPAQGLGELDTRMGRDGSSTKGFWTISTTAEPHCLGASLKYSIDAGRLCSQLGALIFRSTPEGKATHLGKGVRMEADLVSNTLRSRFLALRCLKRIGRFSKLGLEVGMSTYNLHLALYWSRLGQSIRLPILVSSGSSFGPRLLFWTAVVPFSGLALWECAQYWWQRVGNERRERNDSKRVQERRAEADDLAILLSFNVENRQEVEREEHGLVIRSAKYGVKTGESWGLEEVADVTTAVGALVDDGQLYIPSNVNKSNILGFWDPVPHATKTLHVRYLFQGKEGTVEVIGQEPLSLPLRVRPQELA